ncbi:unnamed protein product, partial [Symbiodinium microadriaticum]
CPPVIYFFGGGRVSDLERASYHDSVKVFLAPRGHLNRQTNQCWTEVWKDFKEREMPDMAVLLTRDNVDPQRLASWRDAMQATNTTAMHGEPGYTHVWQMIDRHVGKTLRNLVQAAQEGDLADENNFYNFKHLTARDRRILARHLVGQEGMSPPFKALLQLIKRTSHLYSYAVPSEPALRRLAAEAPLLEIGAGTGYWAYLLRRRSVVVHAYDIRLARDDNDYHGHSPAWTRVERGGPEAAANHAGSALFLCYPPPGNMALQVLNFFPGNRVLLVGEWSGDTASQKFQEKLMQTFELVDTVPLPNWADTAAALSVWQRRPRPLKRIPPEASPLRCWHCGAAEGLKRCRLSYEATFCSKACASKKQTSTRHRANLTLRFALAPGEQLPDFSDADFFRCAEAFRSTGFFIGFVLILLIVGLNFRPGHKESLDGALQSEESAVRWLNDLLDVDHKGLNAVSFAIACLTLAGVLGWALYTAYGLAAMPFDWIRGKQSPAEQRLDVEMSIASIRDKYRSIQSRYSARDDGSLDLSRMKAADRKELTRLQREHKSLMQHNYRLQEVEQQAKSCIPRLLQCLVPFRFLVGAFMMSLSLLVVLSLLLTLVDRLLHSPCGWSCGYTLQERRIYNPADEVYLRLSRIFPVDFVFLSVVVLYIFAATLFGIVALDIRLLCISVYTLRARKSAPQALLVMCNAMAYILLALCVALLTIAPDYTAFGSQTRPSGGANGSERCSLAQSEQKCQVSVIAKFFTRI